MLVPLRPLCTRGVVSPLITTVAHVAAVAMGALLYFGCQRWLGVPQEEEEPIEETPLRAAPNNPLSWLNLD